MSNAQSQKPKMRDALVSSLNAESTAFKSRFERAEAVLNGKSKAPPIKPARNPKKVAAQVPATGRAVQSALAPAPTPVQAISSRVVRDSFTMPQSDYEAIGTVRERALRSGFSATKSEILRAGVLALMQMDNDDLATALTNLQKVKTGRPTTV